jgi:hypothetical protein
VNHDQYNALCNACDQLLLAPDSGDERIATPWLHVIRPHPIFLEGYADIFNSRFGTNWNRRIRNMGSALRHLAKACLSSGKPWASVGELPEKCDVLMISHLVSTSILNQDDDFYYGEAACKLAEQGLSSTIALINYTDTAPDLLAVNWRQPKVPRVIFTTVLGFAAECMLYWRAHVAARHLKKSAAAQSNDLSRRVKARAVIESTSGGAVSALRLGEQIKALVVRLKPRAILVTYEGHSWERIAFAVARKVSPKIQCIGYQHATLFNQQHAVQRRLADKYNPDAILTSGKVAQSRLQKNQQLQDVKIVTLGSNRSFACQPAHEWRSSNGEKKVCLVLPEGILSECNLLFGFSLQCARSIPNIEFIWRLHPNMNYEALTRQNPSLRNLPSNIVLSSSTLGEDIARSHLALYRGSTAIVQAGVLGVRPVYLHQPNEVPIDTLYEIAELHARVVEPEDLRKLLEKAEEPHNAVMTKQVQDHCGLMFTPMDTRELRAYITETRKVEARL